MSPHIGAAAAACAYRNSALRGKVPGYYFNGKFSFCGQVQKVGWFLADEYTAEHSGSNDSDSVDVYRAGPHCLVALHGSDKEGFSGTWSDTTHPNFYGYKNLFQKTMSEELEVILGAIRARDGSLGAWTASCPGQMIFVGHGMGAAMASIFAYLANQNGDPLKMNKHISGVGVYASPPVATKRLTDDHTEDGCFNGVSYYSRMPPEYLPNYESLGDKMMVDTRTKPGLKHVKMAFIALDIKGDVRNQSNILGPGPKTPCTRDGSGKGKIDDPPILAAMTNNATLYAKATEEWSKVYNPSAIGFHDLEAYVWNLDPLISDQTRFSNGEHERCAHGLGCTHGPPPARARAHTARARAHTARTDKVPKETEVFIGEERLSKKPAAEKVRAKGSSQKKWRQR